MLNVCRVVNERIATTALSGMPLKELKERLQYFKQSLIVVLKIPTGGRRDCITRLSMTKELPVN